MPVETNQQVVVDKPQPFSEAHVTLVEGDQGQGKSVTATGLVVDAYRNDCVRLFCRDKLKIDCEVKAFDPKGRIAKIKQNGNTIWNKNKRHL